MEELTLIIVVIGVIKTPTVQRRSHSTLREQLFGKPFGMVEIMDESSLIQMYVNGDNYLHKLHTEFWPVFAALPFKDPFVFMQEKDGATRTGVKL